MEEINFQPSVHSSKSYPHHIIGIGFSAWGIDPLNKFFDYTPHDGVSYVIIQHLPPDYKSRMAEMLSKHSKVTIHEIGDGMFVEANRVYLKPERKKYYHSKRNTVFIWQPNDTTQYSYRYFPGFLSYRSKKKFLPILL